MKELSGDFDQLEQAYAKQYDLDQLVETYSRKWDDTKEAIARDVDAPAMREREHQQRHADTEDAIRHVHSTLMDHINETPDVEIVRDATGKASHIKKGERILTIQRGPDGRATGLK